MSWYLVLLNEFQKNILVVWVYRSPKGDVASFLEKIRKFLGGVHDDKKLDLLSMGDFNIAFSRPHDVSVKKL